MNRWWRYTTWPGRRRREGLAANRPAAESAQLCPAAGQWSSSPPDLPRRQGLPVWSAQAGTAGIVRGAAAWGPWADPVAQSGLAIETGKARSSSYTKLYVRRVENGVVTKGTTFNKHGGHFTETLQIRRNKNASATVSLHRAMHPCRSLFLVYLLAAARVGCPQTVGATFGDVVRLSGTPSDVVLDESRGRLYLVNSNTGQVDIYDYVNKSLAGSIRVGATPVAAAISMDSRFLYVSNNGSSTLSVIAGASDRQPPLQAGRSGSGRRWPRADHHRRNRQHDQYSIVVCLRRERATDAAVDAGAILPAAAHSVHSSRHYTDAADHHVSRQAGPHAGRVLHHRPQHYQQ